jgi:hypothetical protein
MFMIQYRNHLRYKNTASLFLKIAHWGIARNSHWSCVLMIIFFIEKSKIDHNYDKMSSYFELHMFYLPMNGYNATLNVRKK